MQGYLNSYFNEFQSKLITTRYFQYHDNYIDSISYFKKILSNYNKDHHVFKDNEDTLDKIINAEGIIFKNELFELMLIRENVKYKFYITAPGGFFSSKWKW